MKAEEILTPVQIKALKTLGILDSVVEKLNAEAKAKPRKKLKAKPAQEYILEVEQKCKLCDTKYRRLYYMKVCEEQVNVLESELIPLEKLPTYAHLPYMLEQRTVFTCGSCRDYLHGKTKGELISIILRGKRYAQMG